MISDSGKYNAKAWWHLDVIKTCDFELLNQKDRHSSCLQTATLIFEHGNEVKQAKGSSGQRKSCQQD